MKHLLLFFLLTTITPSFAQQFTYPALPQTAKTLNGFIPTGWVLKDSTTGDLDNDGKADIAFIIEYKDTVNELRADSIELVSRPRVLGVIFGTTKGFTLAVQHNTFILRNGEGGGMSPEPYGELRSNNGYLLIGFQFLREYTEYTFKYISGKFCLIYARDFGTTGPGDAEGWTFDFINKKAVHEKGRIDEDEMKQEEKEIPMDKLKSLEEMKQPFEWEVLPNVFI